MTNIETLQNIFVDVFGDVSSKLGDDFTKDNVDGWDSVHQLNIIALIEDNFDLMLDPEDIIACTSYNSAKEILSKYNVEI
jgi:acyl carrier protein